MNGFWYRYIQIFFIWSLFLSAYYVTAVKDDIPEDEEGYLSDDGKVDESVISGPPARMISTPVNFLVHLGDNVTLPCVVENINPSGVLIWSKLVGNSNATILYVKTFNIAHIERYVVVRNETDLQINNVTIEDEGRYNCSSSVTPKVHVIHSITIYRPATIVALQPNTTNFNVRKGESLTVYCNVDGVPNPTIQWRKLKDAVNVDNYDLISKDGLLTLKPISENDAGRYVCWANNTENKVPAMSDVINVSVTPAKTATVMKITAENPIIYADNSDVSELVCIVTGNKLKVNWLKSGQKINNSGHFQQRLDNGRAILKIDGVKSDDFGEYTCQITSASSSFPDETRWDVVQFYGAPQKPKIQSSSAQAGNPILTWIVESSVELINYTISYTGPEDSAEHFINQSYNGKNATTPYIVSHVFENLPNGQYKAKLQVQNRHGLSKPSEEYTFAVDNGSNPGVPVEVAKVGGSGSTASQLRIYIAILFAFIVPVIFC